MNELVAVLCLFLEVIAVCVFAIVFGIMLIISFAFYLAFFVNTLLSSLPWMKWLTLDELVTNGHSRFMSALALTFLHEEAYLEVRLRKDDVPNDMIAIVKATGFRPPCVKYYDFRLIRRGGRRQRKLRLILSSLGSGLLNPAPA